MATTSSWKRALGAVKDKYSIGIAKIASAHVPDLEVAVVKATSHDDMGIDEKHIQEILHLTSTSLGYANACLQLLTKRISKTHNWIVAVKVLLVTHRLLREGNSAFEDDLRYVSRRSLNITNFRDESHSNAWDFSAFVRNYASYLDARLFCSLMTAAPRGARSVNQDDLIFFYNPTINAISHMQAIVNSDYYENSSMESSRQKKKLLAVKEMSPEMLLDFLPSLQQMVDRVLSCRPTGAAKNHRLVQVPLYLIVRESFQVYSDLCEGMGSILNVYFDMKLENCSRAFDMYVRFSRQADSLSNFYNSVKGMGICRPSEFPQVEKVSPEYLDTLEDFLRDLSRSVRTQQPAHRPQDLNAKGPHGEQNDKEIDPASFERIYGVKALPAPPTETPQTITKEEKLPNLIDLGDEEPVTATPDDKMALALFPDASGATVNNNWATFDTTPVQEASQKSAGAVSDVKRQPSPAGLSGWELALVSEASSLGNTKPAPTVGNFDRFQFETMYNPAAAQPNPATVLSGSASSVATFARQGTPAVLALPAPGSFTGQDPFAGSASIRPPHYVQLADLQEKQRQLLQGQQQWQAQSQTYGPYGLVQLYPGSYAPAYMTAVVVPQPALSYNYGMAPGYSQAR